MNLYEKQMVDLLKKGQQEYGVVGVKAEFEAEGTRVTELFRLMDIIKKAGVKFALKIGGCEAIRDLKECKQFGVDYIIAPMIETSYALQKYIAAKDKVYSKEEQSDTKFLFNLETSTGFQNYQDIVSVARDGADGVVFGRGDFTESLKLARDEANCNQVTDACVAVAAECKKYDLDFVVGGSMARESIPALNQIAAQRLDRFETRKVIFSADALNLDIENGINLAVEFELLWLLNKREHYQSLSQEDQRRITSLENRQKIVGVVA